MGQHGIRLVPSSTSDAIVKAAEEFRRSFNEPFTYRNMSTTDFFNAFSNQYISERGDALFRMRLLLGASH